MTKQLQINDLSHLSEEEFVALCPQGEHAPGPEPLSPAAQAVLDAFSNASDFEYIKGVWVANEGPMLAAVIRAAADQVVPPSAELEFYDRNPSLVLLKAIEIRTGLLVIATELEAQP